MIRVRKPAGELEFGTLVRINNPGYVEYGEIAEIIGISRPSAVAVDDHLRYGVRFRSKSELWYDSELLAPLNGLDIAMMTLDSLAQQDVQNVEDDV